MESKRTRFKFGEFETANRIMINKYDDFLMGYTHIHARPPPMNVILPSSVVRWVIDSTEKMLTGANKPREQGPP